MVDHAGITVSHDTLEFSGLNSEVSSSTSRHVATHCTAFTSQ